MPAIGFLACDTTLPGSSDRRRGDAFEHDLMIAALEPEFTSQDLELRVIDWEAPLNDFAGIDLVLLGTTWNYQDKSEAFIAKLEALSAAGIMVCNSPEIVRWNAQKTYLRRLEEAGATTIPTLWHQSVGTAEVEEAFYYFDCEQLVVKRQIGAGALGQERLTRGEVAKDWRFDHPAMLQPFLPAIAEEGELSFVFIDGQISHALRKRPADGDYRIQSLYGGTEEVYHPTANEAAAAQVIIEALPFEAPLYARIDMLRAEQGKLMLMEAELIEPYLYPEQGPELGERLVRGIRNRLSD